MKKQIKQKPNKEVREVFTLRMEPALREKIIKEFSNFSLGVGSIVEWYYQNKLPKKKKLSKNKNR